MTTGISSRTGETIGAARNVDPVLSNLDRVKYEMNKIRARLNFSKSSEFLGEFTKVRKEFDGFITYAQVINEKDVFLSFSPPDIRYAISFWLPSQSSPVSLTRRFLIAKNTSVPQSFTSPNFVVTLFFFQAIIGDLEAYNFAEYFIQLFKQMKINKYQFLGKIMEFSAAQRLGFMHAFHFYFNNSADGSGSSEQMTETLGFLKGSYMHWMQSVQRVISNHAVAAPSSEVFWLSKMVVIVALALR
ncbi:uncharacterized protein B0P05DRAFT_573733 [Gilbertella persicaria]|uniref:uncharacterized protein n=1 Tax=Gilbertella persicaria TaxID=101096 RepID=UPI00221FC071|nr:uncharacterized protein B0P05DRAFT_573733 [Gilbertella persicaria]KAI8067676.1 hypothetical protein B0P05DRAFT_573733 [Gilbertella persicaria]